jgi:hypothetical protein
MYIEIIPDGGIGRGAPFVLHVNQVTVRQDNGTIVAVAAVYGAADTLLVTHAGDKDFNDNLRKLNIAGMTIVDRLELPSPPPGAKIIAGPSRL